MEMRGAGETRIVEIGQGILSSAADVFRACFTKPRAIIIADQNTWPAAGDAVTAALASHIALAPALILPGSPVHADMPTAQLVRERLADVMDAIAVAVGSGTINDLVKFASHQVGRPYMVVATAASMDGYTAFGASLTHQGSKQTFDCPAPRALLADIDVIATAPAAMAAAGYADLAAKITAGADWLLADALDIEPIDQRAWQKVQSPLRTWLAQPDAIRNADKAALHHLLEGLVASGLAMQITRTSRPASGAEHQFSHLWDMEGHTHDGRPVPHGFKVAIGTLASLDIYESLLSMPLDQLQMDQPVWPSPAGMMCRIEDLHPPGALREKAVAEMQAKCVTAGQLSARLTRLRQVWPDLRGRLREQLMPTATLRNLLQAAGAPTHLEQIGITRERMRVSYYRAWTIRRRYTVLDLAAECGFLDQLVENSFTTVWRQEA